MRCGTPAEAYIGTTTCSHRPLKDEDWLLACGSHGWVVLHSDKNIRRRPLERQAFLSANLRVFVLASGSHLRREEKAAIFLQHLQRIEQMAREEKPPFIAGVTKSGVHLYDLAVTRQRSKRNAEGPS